MPTWVLYHANCYDGFGAAWAAWRALGETNVRYVPMQYGDPFPSVGGATPLDDVYCLDFSFPRRILEWWQTERENVRGTPGAFLVLDHHKSAQEALAGLPFATFNLHKSGAVLAWEHFHPGQPVPAMLQYIQDRDLWQFCLPCSREVAAWMRSWAFDFSLWDTLAGMHEGLATGDRDYMYLRDEGAAILRFQDQQVRLMADAVRWIVLSGYRVPCVNVACFFSEVGDELCRRHAEALFAAYYFDRADGKRQWGLRSRSGFDCSTVAVLYGGGGHPGAAGFLSGQTFRGDEA